MEYLFILAVLPVIILGYNIYKRDNNKEPEGLLTKIFFLGLVTCIPVIICELLAGIIFDTNDSSLSFLHIFINVFFGVGLIEEFFKWIVTKKCGYENKEFDEVYDIIVYSVFASLGFACIENILYVLANGFSTAIVRAFLSVPGHACFGVIMGYFFAQAKIDELRKDKINSKNNLILSLIIPSLVHTLYDALLIAEGNWNLLLFFIFDIFMVIYCLSLVNKMSKMQQSISDNINGDINRINTQLKQTPQVVEKDIKNMIVVCPNCKRKHMKNSKCPNCTDKENKS